MSLSNDKEYQELVELFSDNPKEAINKSKELIAKASRMPTYDDFYSYHLQRPHISTCQEGWEDQRMSIHCFDCSLSESSCTCLKCFLNGNHEGHNYSICPLTIGNCDCGDTSQWKQSGFCANHPGLKEDSHPEDYLSEELRTLLTEIIFKAAFTAIKDFVDEDEFTSEILKFISSFLPFGDGFRRLISISLVEKMDFVDFVEEMEYSSLEINQMFIQFLNNLFNDQIFKQKFPKVIYKIFFKNARNIKEPKNELWGSSFFHAFDRYPIQYSIINGGFDWISFYIKLFNEIKEILTNIGNEDFNENLPSYFQSATIGFRYCTLCLPNEEGSQQFFDRFVCEVLSKETKGSPEKSKTIVLASFKDHTEKSYYKAGLKFIFSFANIFDGFKFLPNLKFDVLFEKLNELVDIKSVYLLNKDNDKFINKFVDEKKIVTDYMMVYPSFYYNSFHNGASFHFVFVIYDALVNLFGLENICRIKIARILMRPEYQQLRIYLTLITIKKILSFACLDLSLVPKNFGLITILNFFLEDPNFSSYYTKYFPLLQLLIGLQCNNSSDEFGLKEFFNYEIAREIGIFDDFSCVDYKDENINDKLSLMIFAFLYLSLIAVSERILFNFNPNDFIREQLVFAMKNGVTMLNDLSNSYDVSVSDDKANPINFNNVLFSIASIKSNSSSENFSSDEEDVSFVLKNEVKMNPISAVISFNNQKSLLNKEISKNPNDLIVVQDFEPEETYFFNTPLFSTSSLTTNTYYTKNEMPADNEIPNHDDLKIHLKELLFTPTILSVVYHSMRRNSEFEPSKIDLNDHLCLNVLILISKFLPKNNSNETETEFVKQIEYSSIDDLINKMRNEVFKYDDDENHNATIKNPINSDNFDSFLNIKFSYQNNMPKSFLDLINEKGEIGKKALSLMSNKNNDGVGLKTEKNEKLMKKQKANLLKEEILKKYKSMISTYSIDESSSESLDLLSPTCSGVINGMIDVCPICSTIKKGEALCYPLFLYRTKFPFIVDKPPLVIGNENEFSCSCDDDLDYDSDDEEINEDETAEFNEGEEAAYMQSLAQQYIMLRNSENPDERLLTTLLITMQQIQENIERRKEEFQKKKIKIMIAKRKKKLKLIRREKRKEERKVKKPRRYTAGSNFVVQFNLCQHLIHPSCTNKSEYNCPIDRHKKNSFLPSLEKINKEEFSSISVEVVASIQAFMDNFKKFALPGKNRQIDLFVELIKSLSGLIVTYEMRLRSNPGCLDSNDTKLLSRNLFLTTYLAYRIEGKPKLCDVKPYNNSTFDDVDSRLTEFQLFVKSLIQNDEIESPDMNISNLSFEKIVNSFISKQKECKSDKEIILFLRRVNLANYFLLGNSEKRLSLDNFHTELIDWDDLLSISNLSEKFKTTFSVNEDDIEFKPFVCCQLPENFLHFYLEPYKFPIELCSKVVIANLIDYNYLIDNYNEDEIENYPPKMTGGALTLNDEELQVELKLNFNSKNYPCFLLFLGKFASRVLVISNDESANMKPFFLDKYGSPNFGFKRNQPIFLNHERFEKFIDKVISGDFSNYFK